jgi:hypothetical protein
MSPNVEIERPAPWYMHEKITSLAHPFSNVMLGR